MKKYTFYKVMVKVVAGTYGTLMESVKYFSTKENAQAYEKDWLAKAADLGITLRNQHSDVETIAFNVEDELDARISLPTDAELQAAMGNKPRPPFVPNKDVKCQCVPFGRLCDACKDVKRQGDEC